MIEVKSPVEYKNIPDNPGVYLMKNEKGKIIYVTGYHPILRILIPIMLKRWNL